METTPCHFCRTTTAMALNAPHWTGTEYLRVHVCKEQACREQIAKAPRAPRKPRAERVIYLDRGGWSAIPGLNAAMAGNKGKLARALGREA